MDYMVHLINSFNWHYNTFIIKGITVKDFIGDLHILKIIINAVSVIGYYKVL